MHTPKEISAKEWDEIMLVPEVQNLWDIKFGDTPDAFIRKMYGAKFVYESKSQVSFGDLYVLFSDSPRPKMLSLVRRSTGLHVMP